MDKRRVVLFALFTLIVSGCVVRGQRLETTEGTLGGHDLAAPALVTYDHNGVPHIEAESDRDLFYAIGYVQAQDRFFFMDVVRKVGSGELSQLLGRMPGYKSYRVVTADKVMRSLMFRERAEKGVRDLDPRSRELLDAYCAGVNRYLDDAEGKIPEYKALGIKPDRWVPEDAFVCFDLYGLTMTAYSFFYEYYAERLVRTVGPGKAMLFVPAAPRDSAFINEDYPNPASNDKAMEALGGLLSALSPLLGNFGSNNWVIGGEISASGMPVLANDPHVPTIFAPTFWWHAHIKGETFDAAGLMFSGVPLMGSGTNGEVAWGITNARCDYIDIFREKVRPGDPGQYFHNGEWKDFEIVSETIRVKHGPDIKHRFRRSVHGPVIEESTFGIDYKWSGGDVYTIKLVDVELGRFFAGYLDIPRSKSAGEMRDAVEDMRMGPVAWNTVYATTSGDIGYLYSGHPPVRPDNQGVLPRNGDGSADWEGLIPYDELPHVKNPGKHFIVTANNRVEPWDYPHYLSSGYALASRADRITELLRGRTGLAVRDMEDIQMDVGVKSAERLTPVLLEDLEGAGDPRVETAAELLREWNDRGCLATLDSRGTGIYEVMVRDLAKRTFRDELGGPLYSHMSTADMILHALFEIIGEEDSEWWDDVNTPERETRADLVRAAAAHAYDYNEKKMGKDPADWEWGELHFITIRTILGFPPWNKKYRVTTRPLAGTDESPKAAGGLFFGALGFVNLAGPSSRVVVDMAEPRVIHFNASTGNSENPSSEMYDTTTDAWFEGDYVELSLDREDYERGAMGELTLAP